MSLETRSSSALFKRAEQLKRWEESETNREPSEPTNNKPKKVKFSSGCVFLAACKAGDKEEILRLLKKGADIGTTDVDGLSALHQACIDDNLDLVEFLVEHGADVNKGDNEGWTPLHATASCGFISIAKYLIEHGANVAAVNNDGELPVHVAESDEMEDMLQHELDYRGIDAEEVRTEEERVMLADAQNWLSSGRLNEKPHPKTGATSLHVAAAKGYLNVMDILIKAGADVDAQDFDGWTPLHAAAYWEQKEACEILVENFCDMDKKNLVGQTPFDVTDHDMGLFLMKLKKKQATLPKDNIINKRQNNNKKLVMDNEVITESIGKESPEVENIVDTRQKVPELHKVELYIKPEVPSENQSSVERKNRVNRDEAPRIHSVAEVNKTVPNTPIPSTPPKQPVPNEGEETLTSWRRPPGSIRPIKTGEISKPTSLTLRVDKDQVKVPSSTGPTNRTETPQEVVLRRTQSFEADEKFYRRYLELRAKINAGNSCPALHATPMRSASLKEKHFARRNQVREETRLPNSLTTTPTIAAPPTVTIPPPASASPQNTQVRRSFVPPVRDEESETQRKAHAKRVRETRRSTQGVTLEEIKSAEQLVKKKQQQQLQQATQQLNNPEPSDHVVVNVHNALPEKKSETESAAPTVSATLLRGSETDNKANVISSDRRPSWRLKVDNGSKFMLEDVRQTNEPPSSEVVIKKAAVVTPVTDTGETTVSIPLRKNRTDDREQDKENDVRAVQATQAVIQRRRRPKRRSTGVVHVDMDEIDPERQSDSNSAATGSGDTDDSLSINNSESGGEQSERSRVASESSSPEEVNKEERNNETKENGELDYKKLYEEQLDVNERLRQKLRMTEDDLAQAKLAEKNALAPSRNSLSETERRERRAMERKLSEMEEELKHLAFLKSENQRLKDENGALIRVISKLSK